MIIAEIAQAHDGSVGILHSYIDALAATGVDVIKFQTHIADAESSEFEPFRKKFSYVDKSRFDYWKRMELTLEQWQQIKKHCDEVNVEFMSSPFSCEAVNLLEKLNVKRYKIGSGEVTNHLLLRKIAAMCKPVILSSGMSSYEELDEAVEIFTSENIAVSVLQCTTAYPTTPNEWGLNIIRTLKERYNIPTGFSDHSGDIYACLAATALGAEIIEFHAVFDKRMFGPDASSSIEIDDVRRLVDGVKQIRRSLLKVLSKDSEAEKVEKLKMMFGKSLAINRDLPEGYILTEEDLEAKKPSGYGIPAKDYEKAIGKRLKCSLKQWDFLESVHIQSP
ncbi:MAG TPA: N-acetylneuraminate synthase family protein [Segetibacter sp.]|jgi:N-acetylneuraminate synthase